MEGNFPFPVAYLGSVQYFLHLLKHKEIYIEKQEKWVKQTYRNRCYIDSPNGKLMLNIPVKHSENKQIDSIEVSYDDHWHLKHWQAIKTTYSSSPFFEILGPDLKDIYDQKTPLLFNLNMNLTRTILSWLQVDPKIHFTEEWQTPQQDRENLLHPGRETQENFPVYPQVFDHKHGFIPNLSIIDLLFNEGPAAFDYFSGISLHLPP